MLQGLFGKIMGWIIIIVTLALAPQVNTANALITGHASVANMTGMTAVGAFGAPLIILGELVLGGAFAIAGAKGRMGGTTAADMLKVIGAVIIAIVGLTFMATIMTYVETLIDVSSGFARTIYAIIPLILYVGLIIQAGWTGINTYRGKGGKGKKAAAYGY